MLGAPGFGLELEIRKEPGPSPIPDHPADFPPGSAGSNSGPSVDPIILEKILDVNENFEIAWHPVLNLHTIWKRYGSGNVHLVTPVWDPDTEEPILLDERTVAVLIDSEPRLQESSRAMFQKARRWAKKREQNRWNQTRGMIAECRHKVWMTRRIAVGYGRHTPRVTD